mgnify:FL=1
MKSLARFVILLVILASSVPAATTGSITGTIKDPMGAVIPAVTVTATNTSPAS